MSDYNSNNLARHHKESTRKARISKLEAEGFEATVQQYTGLEPMPEIGQVGAADPLLAADQIVLRRAIANPRLLTPQTAPSIQRTVGNRTAQWMIARAVAGQQSVAESSQAAKTSLELELEAIVNRRFGLSDRALADQWGAGEEIRIEMVEPETGEREGATHRDVTQLRPQLQRGKARRRSILRLEDEDELEQAILPKERG
jgi:hypothetical protein